MALVINTNIASINAQRNLSKTQLSLNKALARLSSGLRINSAKDDAAGLAISDRMTAQIRGMSQAVRNANDGISLAQTAEGALHEVTNMLQRIRELAVQSANDTNSSTDRASLQKEVAQLQQEITRIASQTNFNGRYILDGSMTAAVFHIGANADQTISFSIASVKANEIGSYTVNANDHVGAELAAGTAKSTNGVAAQTLTIIGPDGTENVDIAANSSAKAIADAVNAASSKTGVQAKASTSLTLTAGSVSGTSWSFNLYGVNGDAQVISATVASPTDLSSLADAINAKSSITGVVATLSDDKTTITLSNDQGYDITIEDIATGNDGDKLVVAGKTLTYEDDDSGDDSITVGGTVEFSAVGSFSITSDDDDNTILAADSVSGELSDVASIDVTSQSGANSAIKVIDGALMLVDNLRAALGAVQNRFESTISNLQNLMENVSAARSRIMDADFAQETAEMTRGQILQQAGIAMLAQTNQLPQMVLSLLQ